MRISRAFACLLLPFALVLATSAAAAAAPVAAKPISISFGGTAYLHRWSKAGQNEFTPAGQEDLGRWKEMVTVNVHESVRDGDQLAGLANGVLGNYEGAGKILRTDSKPRTAQRPAEHLIVAMLPGKDFIEAAFARLVLVDGTGFVVVYSHRAYGPDRVEQIGAWVQKNGQSTENTLMAWQGMPALAKLKALPQAKR